MGPSHNALSIILSCTVCVSLCAARFTIESWQFSCAFHYLKDVPLTERWVSKSIFTNCCRFEIFEETKKTFPAFFYVKYGGLHLLWTPWTRVSPANSVQTKKKNGVHKKWRPLYVVQLKILADSTTQLKASSISSWAFRSSSFQLTRTNGPSWRRPTPPPRHWRRSAWRTGCGSSAGRPTAPARRVASATACWPPPARPAARVGSPPPGRPCAASCCAPSTRGTPSAAGGTPRGTPVSESHQQHISWVAKVKEIVCKIGPHFASLVWREEEGGGERNHI